MRRINDRRDGDLRGNASAKAIGMTRARAEIREQQSVSRALSEIELLERGLHDRILNGAEHELDVLRVWWFTFRKRSMQKHKSDIVEDFWLVVSVLRALGGSTCCLTRTDRERELDSP